MDNYLFGGDFWRAFLMALIFAFIRLISLGSSMSSIVPTSMREIVLVESDGSGIVIVFTLISRVYFPKLALRRSVSKRKSRLSFWSHSGSVLGV